MHKIQPSLSLICSTSLEIPFPGFKVSSQIRKKLQMSRHRSENRFLNVTALSSYVIIFERTQDTQRIKISIYSNIIPACSTAPSPAPHQHKEKLCQKKWGTADAGVNLSCVWFITFFSHSVLNFWDYAQIRAVFCFEY